MSLLIRYGLRSLWVRRTATLATAVGIALVVFVLAASQMLAAGMRSTLLSAGHVDRALVMRRDAYAESDSSVRQSALGLVRAAPGVRKSADGQTLAFGESVMHLMLPRLDDETRISSVQLRGVDDRVALLRPQVRVVRGRAPSPSADEAMLGVGIEGDYAGMQLGGSFELKKGRSIQVVGVFEAAGTAHESEVWLPLDVLRASMGWQGYLSSITAQLDSPAAFDGFVASLQVHEQAGLAVERERDYYEKVSESLSDNVRILGSLVVAIFSIGATLGAAITFYGAVSQRRREIGVLRALGFSAGAIMTAFVLESLVLSLLGAALGAGLSALTPLIEFSTTNWGTGNEIEFPFEARPSILLNAVSVGVAVGALGGVFPALGAARTNPVAAMRV